MHSIFTPLFLTSASLLYLILAVPIAECLGKHSRMSSTFSIAMLIGTYFATVQLQVHYVYSEKYLSTSKPEPLN